MLVCGRRRFPVVVRGQFCCEALKLAAITALCAHARYYERNLLEGYCTGALAVLRVCARLDRKPPSAVATRPRKLRLFLERERDSAWQFLGRERDSARREPAGVDDVAAAAEVLTAGYSRVLTGYSDYAAVTPGGARSAG